MRDDTRRVAVVSELRLLRQGVARLLEESNCTVEVASPDAMLADDRRSRSEVGVVDVSAAGQIETLRRLAQTHPSMRLVALGVRSDDEHVVACIEAGATAYVSRDADLDELLAAIDSAARDEARCEPRVVATLMRRLASRTIRVPAAELHNLTAREREVLALIAGGYSNKEIAVQLRLGVTTVKNHVHAVLTKLNVTRRGQAAAKAREAPATQVDAARI
jgi:DNA-binding NarL/FixJ family response regulator